MRGIGWVILFEDPVTDRLSNHWVSLHQNGIPAGFKPLLVMDVWEHAFMRDYKATEKAKYVEAFFRNVDWPMVERRLQRADGDASGRGGLTAVDSSGRERRPAPRWPVATASWTRCVSPSRAARRARCSPVSP